MKVLIVGSFVACHGDAESSGTVILLKYLVKDLGSSEGVQLETIDTGYIRRGSSSKIFGFCSVLKDLWSASRSANVIALHLSPMGFATLGLPSLLIARLRKKRVLFRMFGGMDYHQLSWPVRSIAGYVAKRVDCVMVETKQLYSLYSKRGLRKLVWFPNVRPMPPASVPNPHSEEASRYLFIAQIKKEKGIFEVIEAFKELGADYQIDVFGPFYDGLSESIFAGVDNVNYRGVLPHVEVYSRMQNSKALVFPTYLKAEGYSGIVLEAFSAGLPVICTRWKFLPELVDDTCGILVEPKDVNAIVKAIIKLDSNQELRNQLSAGAYARRAEFSVENGTSIFISVCRSLCSDSQEV